VYQALEILTLLLAALAMALPLAHALELPGKLRLRKDDYLAVQPIYYPGFTIGGFVGDPGAPLATLVLAIATPTDTPQFWLALVAFVAFAAMNATYWILTHPVNGFWLSGSRLSGAGARFFAADPLGRARDGGPPSWTQLRNRWELSHVVRAVLGVVGFVVVAIAVVL
jgi:hypothetical protein